MAPGKLAIPPDEDIQKVRQRMLDRKGGSRDPNEYRFPKARGSEKHIARFRTLQPTESMKGLWYYVNGSHYVNNKRLECPRIHDNEECPLCSLGFQLMEDQSKEKRSAIAKAYISRKYYAINAYFPPFTDTPEDLRGKIFWINLSQTLYDKCEECIMRDSAGDDSDPQAFGNFYSPKSGYVLQVIVKSKNDYNSYEESKFLVSTKGPLHKDESKIVEILGKRYDVPSKFQPRDMDALQAEVDKLLNKGPKGGGFDADKSGHGSEPGSEKPAEEELEQPPAESRSPKPPKAAAKPQAQKPPEEAPAEVPTEAPAEVPEETPGDGGPEADAELKRLLSEIKKEKP